MAAEPVAAPDTLAQRLKACTACHASRDRQGPDGYYPRLAGKPAAYLYQQLLNVRERRREHLPMRLLLQPLDDAYLREIARYFATLPPTHADPAPIDNPAAAARGALLVRQGDPARGLPACTACHGAALTGRLPAVPGLLGLPRNYLVAQLSAWRQGQRHALAPDCMATVARALQGSEVADLAQWLAAQPVPAQAGPEPASAAADLARPLDCAAPPAGEWTR